MPHIHAPKGSLAAIKTAVKEAVEWVEKHPVTTGTATAIANKAVDLLVARGHSASHKTGKHQVPDDHDSHEVA